jgi:hypothetical protein
MLANMAIAEGHKNKKKSSEVAIVADMLELYYLKFK